MNKKGAENSPKLRLPKRCVVALALLLLGGQAIAAEPARFSCGGSVESEVWKLWDSDVRDTMDRDILGNRLTKMGDVYALYDFQIYTANMVAMAQRCKRQDRLVEIARLERKAYSMLSPAGSAGRQWICRGGAICNGTNKLINREVMLDSVQFLGLATATANALVTSGAPLDKETAQFVSETVRVATEHLVRWGSDEKIDNLHTRAVATLDKATPSSSLLFTDKDLWLITTYAELSGVLQAGSRQDLQLAGPTDAEKARMRRHLAALMQLLSARLSFRPMANGAPGTMADLDRGYWRLRTDNSYAGYESEKAPARCLPGKDGDERDSIEFDVPRDAVAQRQDTGWDLSHARRLVPALDALERNRAAITSEFSLDAAKLPSPNLARRFARTLVGVVWNGDKDKPLFSNYWSGANGWFRVAYDNGTGRCTEGYPPYGMSESFLTGGYVTWARYNPSVGALGQKMYDLLSSPDAAKSPFITKYYSKFVSGAPGRRTLFRFEFLPSLVGNNPG
jgi:hypothetical protein